jgi:branched-subunit amino acid aminotransferase/4-amino-4-deoxychorismate lyase
MDARKRSQGKDRWCCAGNYAAGLEALLKAKAEDFSDVVYLDARTDTYLEELSAANIFVVKVPALIELRWSIHRVDSSSATCKHHMHD